MYDVETWRSRALQRGNACIGVTCATCFKVIPPDETTNQDNCQCGHIAPTAELAVIHGLPPDEFSCVTAEIEQYVL